MNKSAVPSIRRDSAARRNPCTPQNGSIPLNTPRSTMILSTVCLSGTTVYTTYSGGITWEKFVDYLKNKLIPSLGKEDIVVMDKLRSHHVKEVKETFEKAGVRFLYLPLYSPQYESDRNALVEDQIHTSQS